MEKHIDPQQTQKYLLPDDHHLNSEGNKLVAEQAISLLKGFIYADLGVRQYNEGDTKTALQYFEKSYELQPLNLYNLYNLMVMYFGNEQMDKLKPLIEYVKVNKIDDAELSNIAKIVEETTYLREIIQ